MNVSKLLTGEMPKSNKKILTKVAEFFNVSVDHLLVDNPVDRIYIV